MDIHLYLMCYRTEALVASQLPAEEFGAYMAVGTAKRTAGNVVFFELDPNLKSDYLPIEAAKARCTPHPDGTPKRSKYVSIYRVMEHVPLSAYGKLHLATRDGRVLSLDSAPYDASAEKPGPNMYVELCPVTPRVVSSLAPAAFTKFITDPTNPLAVPRIFFADTLVDRDADGHLARYLPYRDLLHIEDCLTAIQSVGEKMTKTVDRNPPLVAFYRTLRRGFFIGDAQGLKHYPYPSPTELDDKHHKWWRSATLG